MVIMYFPYRYAFKSFNDVRLKKMQTIIKKILNLTIQKHIDKSYFDLHNIWSRYQLLETSLERPDQSVH